MGKGASDHRTAPVDAAAAHGSASATVDLPDRWRLVELLGSGGQATVWLAEDRTRGSRVALKILPADADERTRGRWLEEVRQARWTDTPTRRTSSSAWVPLAEWLLGTALSSTEGREEEARAVLARAAEHAPGTWISTSLTQ